MSLFTYKSSFEPRDKREDRELLKFQKIDGIPPRVKERAEIIRLNHHGWSVAASAINKIKLVSLKILAVLPSRL